MRAMHSSNDKSRNVAGESGNGVNVRTVYLDKLLASPHVPIHHLTDSTKRDIIPKLKNTGVRNKFESVPSRPVDAEGYMTTEFLSASRGKTQLLARKLMKIESRRYPADRTYGAKFDKLLEQKKFQNEKTTSLLTFEHDKLIDDFGPSVVDEAVTHTDDSKTLATRKKAPKKLKEMTIRPKNICSRESLLKCILDTTVITVEPRHIESTWNGSVDDGHGLSSKARDWSLDAIALAQSPGVGSTYSGSLAETGKSASSRKNHTNRSTSSNNATHKHIHVS